MKLPYKVGDCFRLPLGCGKFARGVVTRMDGKGQIFAYYFGPAIDDAVHINTQGCEDPGDAIFEGLCGDLGFIEGDWVVNGPIVNWSKENWPLLPILLECKGKFAKIMVLDEETLGILKLEQFLVSDIEDFIKDGNYARFGLMGSGIVEKKLRGILEIQ